MKLTNVSGSCTSGVWTLIWMHSSSFKPPSENWFSHCPRFRLVQRYHFLTFSWSDPPLPEWTDPRLLSTSTAKFLYKTREEVWERLFCFRGQVLYQTSFTKGFTKQVYVTPCVRPKKRRPLASFSLFHPNDEVRHAAVVEPRQMQLGKWWSNPCKQDHVGDREPHWSQGAKDRLHNRRTWQLIALASMEDDRGDFLETGLYCGRKLESAGRETTQSVTPGLSNVIWSVVILTFPTKSHSNKQFPLQWVAPAHCAFLQLFYVS